MAEVIPEQTIVRVKNLDARRPFVDDYASQRYVIEPGGETIVPYFAMVYWLGDPRAVDVGDRNSQPHLQHRTMELDRLQTKYGTYGDSWYPQEWEINEENADLYPASRHRNLPKLEVTSMTGERLYTVIDDPEGNHLNPATQTVNENRNMAEAVVQMQKQIQALTTQLALADPAAAAALIPFAPAEASEPVSVESIVEGMAVNDDDRDPEPDPDDPAAKAGPDLPPRAQAAKARAAAAAKK